MDILTAVILYVMAIGSTTGFIAFCVYVYDKIVVFDRRNYHHTKQKLSRIAILDRVLRGWDVSYSDLVREREWIRGE